MSGLVREVTLRRVQPGPSSILPQASFCPPTHPPTQRTQCPSLTHGKVGWTLEVTLEPVPYVEAFIHHNIQGCGDSQALLFTLELSEMVRVQSGSRPAVF